MVTKVNKTGERKEKKSRVKINSLKLNRETVKELSGDETKQIKGGVLCVGCTASGKPRMC